jgi:hypothetical protein
MRRYENLHGDEEEEVILGNVLRCNDKIININERSMASHLGIRIENVQSRAAQNKEPQYIKTLLIITHRFLLYWRTIVNNFY